METFLNQATYNEKEIIQTYVDKCLMLHTIALVSAILGPLAFIAGPLVTSLLFPGDIAYPFPTDSNWVWATLYISQSICIIQVGSVDILFGILLWYAGARFEMLCLSRCIEKHQELIGYVDQLRITTRIIAVVVTAVAIYSVTFGGFILIGVRVGLDICLVLFVQENISLTFLPFACGTEIQNPPLFELVKYVFYEVGSALELFLFTWPADNLIAVSEKVGDAAYDCDWIGKPPEMLKNLMIVIQRCKNPMTISVDGLLPVLSLEFYGSVRVRAIVQSSRITLSLSQISDQSSNLTFSDYGSQFFISHDAPGNDCGLRIRRGVVGHQEKSVFL